MEEIEITINVTHRQLITLQNIIRRSTKDLLSEMDELTIFNPQYSISCCELENLAALNNKLTDAIISSSQKQDDDEIDEESCVYPKLWITDNKSKNDCRIKLTLLSHLGIVSGDEIKYDNGDTFIVDNPNLRACIKYKGENVSLNYLIKNVYKNGGGHAYSHFWYQGRKLSDISNDMKKRG